MVACEIADFVNQRPQQTFTDVRILLKSTPEHSVNSEQGFLEIVRSAIVHPVLSTMKLR